MEKNCGDPNLQSLLQEAEAQESNNSGTGKWTPSMGTKFDLQTRETQTVAAISLFLLVAVCLPCCSPRWIYWQALY